MYFYLNIKTNNKLLMDQVISSGEIIHIDGFDYVKFDLGKTYYLGMIDKNIFDDSKIKFPDHKIIIERSFRLYSLDSITITGGFEHDDYTIDNIYKININIISEIINFSQEYIINCICHKKEKVDYLEEEFNKMKIRLLELETLVKSAKILQIKKTDYESDDLASDSEDEESEEEIKPPVITKKPNTSTRKKY
jgi:hypothetical protein